MTNNVSAVPTPPMRTVTSNMTGRYAGREFDGFPPTLSGQSTIEAQNSNYVGGDIVTGANTAVQVLVRPRLSLNPYGTVRTGITFLDEIAERHLISKQIKAHGLKKDEFTLTTEGLRDLIRYYTREAGVRTLERDIAKLARKSLRQIDRKSVV